MAIEASRRRLPVAVLALASTLVAGCGPAVGTVSGDVTFNGKPLGGAVVSFVSPEGTIRTAIANAAGHYAVDQRAGRPGSGDGPPAVAGRRGRQPHDQETRAAEAGARREKSVIPDRYGESTSSGLGTTVKPGGNRYDIALDAVNRTTDLAPLSMDSCQTRQRRPFVALVSRCRVSANPCQSASAGAGNPTTARRSNARHREAAMNGRRLVGNVCADGGELWLANSGADTLDPGNAHHLLIRGTGTFTVTGGTGRYRRATGSGEFQVAAGVVQADPAGT